ncbi:MAG: undecaprenyldiphospho-muramoylpentapeptide beta-N-acetylglucosaminyltransferase [Clostridia bacterium]|nr:undecaprenyldiphospho-muramoylpentapeptide beta-N-acetylglucosaminyltransferase [Clostridia bacterium]
MYNTIVLTGGGTAGHVTPNLVVAKELKKYFKNIYYLGSTSEMERKIISQDPAIKFYSIPSVKLIRGKFFQNLLIPFKLINAIRAAKHHLKEIKPQIIFSKGGYVSVPVVLAAKKLNIPVVCHESDLSCGLANKICAKSAKAVCTTFEKTAEKFGNKGVYTGSPNNLIKPLSKDEAKLKLGIKTTKPILLITGGSLGSQAINEACFNVAKALVKQFYVVHVVGKGNLNKPLLSLASYKQIEFSTQMPTLMMASDLVISRAGSNTIFELATLQKPMLLIPLPKGSSRGDQVENAEYFANKKFALVLPQANLNNQTLLSSLSQLQNEASKLSSTLKKANFKNGTDAIVKTIIKHVN